MAHRSQEWRGISRARPQTHTHPNAPARSGRAQLKLEPKHTHPRRTPHSEMAAYRGSVHTNRHRRQTPKSGVAGRSQNPSPSTHTNNAHPSLEWLGTRGRALRHTHTPTPQQGPARRSQNPSQSIHAHGAHPSQEWRGTSRGCTPTHTPQHPSQEWRGTGGARPQTHTHPNTAARSGWAQLRPEPKHTHPHRTPQPGVAVYKRSRPEKTHTS